MPCVPPTGFARPPTPCLPRANAGHFFNLRIGFNPDCSNLYSTAPPAAVVRVSTHSRTNTGHPMQNCTRMADPKWHAVYTPPMIGRDERTVDQTRVISVRSVLSKGPGQRGSDEGSLEAAPLKTKIL